MKLHYNHLFILLLGALLFSCTTDEFQPDPIGEQVSFEPEQLPTLQEELESSGHSLFLAAWNRSTLSDSLSAWESVPLTILVPSDVAFENAGYTSEFINNARVSLLDSILLYHCLEVNLDLSLIHI